MTSSSIQENLQQRPRSAFDHIIWIPRHEQQHSQEDEASKDPDAYTCDHDLWSLYRGVGNILDHMRDSVESSQAKASLQKPGNAVWPARLIDECSVDEVARRVVWR